MNRNKTSNPCKTAARWALVLMAAGAGCPSGEAAAATRQARSARVAAPQDASEVGLKLEVDKREVEVGDTVTATLEFRQLGTRGGGIVSQGPSIPSLENFERSGARLSSTRIMVVNGRSAEISTTRIGLKAVKPGQASIGPAVILYEDPQRGRREIQSNPALVTVVPKKGFNLFGPKNREKVRATAVPAPPPPAADPDELRDIRGLRVSSFPWSVLFWLALVSLAAAWLIRRFKHPRPGSVPARPKGPAEELRDRFKRLNREDLDGKAFCREASALARACLAYRYAFPAEDWTTSEILAELFRLKAAGPVRDGAENCFKPCDRVLYAEGILAGATRENIRQSLSTLLPKTSG